MTLKIGSNRKLHTTKGLTLAVSLFAVLATACSNQPVQPEKQPSENMANYLQNDFQQYIQDNQKWLRKNRMYLSQNPEQEVQLNSPFELKPDQPNGKAALLVHGLSDSPFSFTDVAQELVDQGFLVRVILLPGHGSKPADLMLPELKDWTAIVRHHTALLSKDYDDIWLGGYSTGANLVTIEAVDNPEIDGLLLFSPAFEPQSGVVRFAPYARYLVDWADEDQEDNIVKFESLAMNGAAVYYETSTLVRDKLSGTSLNIPVFMVMSEGDTVINTQSAIDLYQERFIHSENKLVWFGESKPQVSGLTAYSMALPEYRISTGSHMSALYKPNNAHYGIEGRHRMCGNGQEEAQEKICRNGADVWYSGWGYREENKVHARLSWNPYFEETMEIMQQMFK